MQAFVFPSGFEYIVVLVVVLLLFGHRIPGMARSLGSGITEFKKGLKSGADEQLEAPKEGVSATQASAEQQEVKP